ncbi:hypothetical protein CHS0354_018996, partial [Potamilus streckersoni]
MNACCSRKSLKHPTQRSLDSAQRSTGSNCVKEFSAVPCRKRSKACTVESRSPSAYRERGFPLKSLTGKKIRDHEQHIARW